MPIPVSCLPQLQVLQFARDLAIPSIEVVPCGCLGALNKKALLLRPPLAHSLRAFMFCASVHPAHPLLGARPAAAAYIKTCIFALAGACGSGPNVAVIPLDGTTPLVLRHVSTPQRASDMLREVCCAEVGAC